MTRDRMLTMVRTLHRLGPVEIAEVEEFVLALGPELTPSEMQAVGLYVAVQAARLDERPNKRA